MFLLPILTITELGSSSFSSPASFSLLRWTRTCLGGLPVVLEVHLHNPEVFHDPAVPSQMVDRLKLLHQCLTDLDSLSSVLPNPSTLQQRLSCSFALFSSQRRASVFCSIITTQHMVGRSLGRTCIPPPTERILLDFFRQRSVKKEC